MNSFVIAVLIVTASSQSVTIGRQQRDATAVAVKDAQIMNKISANHLTQLSAELSFPWEGLLQPAPLSVFLLGQLVVLAARRDFSLHLNVTHPYQRLRHTTFRPTIIQVSNEGYVAFNIAHNNMEATKLHMSSIPRNVRSALRIMGSSGTPEQIATYAKIPMNAVQHAGDEGVRLTSETYQKFFDVQLLLAEVAEVLAATQGGTQEQLRQAREDKKLAEEEKKLQTEREVRAQRQFDEIGKQLAKAQEAYQQAIRDIPTGWKAVFMDITRGFNLGKIFSGVMGGGMFGGIMGIIGGGSGAGGRQNGQTGQAEMSVSDFSLGNMANNIRKGFTDLTATFNGGGNNAIDHLSTLKAGLNDLLRQSSDKTDATLFTPVRNLIKSGSQLVDNMRGSLDNPEQMEQLKGEMKTLLGNAKSIAAVQPQMGSSSPPNSQSENPPDSRNNERFIAAQQLNHLHNLERRHDQMFDKLMAENEKLKQILLRISRINLDEINFSEILEILSEAIKAISQLQEKWAELIRFFQIISNVAKVILTDQLRQFLGHAQTAINRGETKFVMNVLRTEMSESAAGTAMVANFLYSLSAAYLNVSSEYLVVRLAGLSGILAITDVEGQKAKLAELHRGSVEASGAILQICRAHKREYEGKLEGEKLRIEQIFDKVGQPLLEDKQAIAKSNALDTGIDQTVEDVMMMF